MIFTVPPPDPKPWPTLGPEVWDWMLDSLIYGPGDLRGIRLSDHPPDDEFRGLLYRMYEVYPRDHPQAGRRRFRRVALSLRKGTAKTERAAWVAAGELHPEAPVRCDGWRRQGSRWDPVGVPVRDPYIPMVAYTEEQVEDLAYHALYTVLSEGPLADDFDIGLERIMRKGGDGKAVALASAPDARDGARTTFQHFDESHRMTLPRLVEAHGTMQANLPKRKLADPWSLETTTAPAPGEGSVAEGTWEYAEAVHDGKLKDSRLFFFHRQASDDHDLTTEDGVRAAVVEASGPAAEWSDIDGIVDLWRDPQTDPAYFERVYTNRLVQQSAQAFDSVRWGELAAPDVEVRGGALIVVGFDGSRFDDTTALVGTTIEGDRGHQFVLGVWERPPRVAEWEVPEREVTATLEAAFSRYSVALVYADPYFWEGTIATWQRRWGKQVREWRTNRWRLVGEAVLGYVAAQRAGELSHDGDERFASHIGNARRREIPARDDQGHPLFAISKERGDSPHKIDIAMAGLLAWEARNDARADGAADPASSELEETPLRPTADEYVDDRGGIRLVGDRYRDRQPGDPVGPSRGRW